MNLSKTTVLSALVGMMVAGCGKGAPSGPEAREVETAWYADVEPLVQEHCVRCHNPDGLGLGDFTDADEAVEFGPAIVAAVEFGRMPPPASAPACRNYVGAEALTLDDAERAVFSAWADAGMPAGDPEDHSEEALVVPSLSEPDLELRIAAPYTPTYAAPDSAGNEYRCFVLDPGHTEPFFITALAPIVDQPSMLHHAVLTTASRDALTAEQRDPSGFDCMGGMGIEASARPLVAWAPGMLPVELPPDMGLRLDGDRVLVLQIHYYAAPGSERLADRSGYAFRTTDAVGTEVVMTQLGVLDFEIPAGDPAFSASGEYTPTSPQELIAVFPHMHRLGAAFSASVEREDGTKECLVEGQYDFDNQLTYQFHERVPVTDTDTIRFSCTWDNASGDATATGFGERTDEEMCFFFTLATSDGEPEAPAVDEVDPAELDDGALRINLATEAGGMPVHDTCSGTVELTREDDLITGTGSCAFEGLFSMLLGTDPLPIAIDGDTSSGTLTLDIMSAQLEAAWQATAADEAVVGVWTGQQSVLELGATVTVDHAGAFKAPL